MPQYVPGSVAVLLTPAQCSLFHPLVGGDSGLDFLQVPILGENNVPVPRNYRELQRIKMKSMFIKAWLIMGININSSPNMTYLYISRSFSV